MNGVYQVESYVILLFDGIIMHTFWTTELNMQYHELLIEFVRMILWRRGGQVEIIFILFVQKNSNPK